jgi:hypothetical protein
MGRVIGGAQRQYSALFWIAEYGSPSGAAAEPGTRREIHCGYTKSDVTWAANSDERPAVFAAIYSVQFLIGQFDQTGRVIRHKRLFGVAEAQPVIFVFPTANDIF